MTALRLLPLVLLLAAPLAAQTTVLPHEGTSGDYFGAALAAGADRIAVGAPSADACGASSGAVHVFEPDSLGAWQAADTLAAPDCRPGLFFGRRVALAGDLLLATASGDFFEGQRTNLVYAFARDSSGAWRLDGRLKPQTHTEEGAFGYAVALDGTRAVVTASGDQDRGRYGGSVYVFERVAPGRWQRTALLRAPSRHAVLGADVALDGDLLVAAAPDARRGRDGRAVAFRFDGQGWQHGGSVDGLRGRTLRVALAGGLLAVAEPDADDERGRVRLYRRTGDAFERAADVEPPRRYRGGRFGHHLALSAGHLAVAAYDEQIGLSTNVDRVAHVFVRSDDWSAVQVADQGSAFFGSALDLSGDRLVAGEADPAEAGRVFVIGLRADARTAMER